jgi:hypothetical protein
MKIGIIIVPILAGILHATTVSDTCVSTNTIQNLDA